MTAPSETYRQQLAAHLVEAEGAALETVGVLLDELLRNLDVSDPTHPVVRDFLTQRPVMDDAGEPLTPRALVEQMRSKLPALFAAKAGKDKSTITSLPRGFRAPRSPEQRRAEGIEAGLQSVGNPWASPGNKTLQVMLEAHDPERAAQLKREASR